MKLSYVINQLNRHEIKYSKDDRTGYTIPIQRNLCIEFNDHGKGVVTDFYLSMTMELDGQRYLYSIKSFKGLLSYLKSKGVIQ